MTPTTLLVGPFAVVGIAAVVVLASPSPAWRGAAEHSRGFWLAWIAGFTAVGFAGPATTGLGWAPTAWFVFWTAVGASQPSMIADVIEVRRFGRRQRALGRRPRISAPPVAVPAVAGVSSPPAIRWQAPSSASLPVGWGSFNGG